MKVVFVACAGVWSSVDMPLEWIVVHSRLQVVNQASEHSQCRCALEIILPNILVQTKRVPLYLHSFAT